MESENGRFAIETDTVMFQRKPIKLTNYTPILTPEQREKRKREIELILYGVFQKYTASVRPQ